MRQVWLTAVLLLPNQALTPGATLPVTATEVCRPGYASSVRHVDASTKAKVFHEYGVQPTPGAYEVDHLISLELGGSNDVKNLWPQSYHGSWNAHVKDVLENRLHRMVCSGMVSLGKAQDLISKDWIATYRSLDNAPQE